MITTGASNQSSFMNSTPSTISIRQSTSTGLAPYTGTWGKSQASHLVRRTHFGNKISDLNRIRALSNATNAVTALVDEAVNAVLPDDPSWFGTNNNDVLDMYDVQFRWMDGMYNGNFLERMLLFWSNHFAVSYQNMNDLPGKAPNTYPSHMYRYVKLLMQNGFGDFKELVRAVSKNSAMVYYLNNYNNRAGQPNEDFARELLELFTLGPLDKNGAQNYTETDVAEVARAVTGWRVNDSNISSFFDDERYDAGSKTIFGQTDTYDMDGVIDLIFNVRAEQSAWFLARKLYVYFVSAEPNATAIQTLADYCITVDFDIRSVLINLLSSAHFYEERFMGARIKSPIEFFMSFLRQFEITPSAQLKEFIRVQMPDLNEELLKPETVFGWDGYNPPDSDGTPGHYSWLNTNLMPSRWSIITNMIYGNEDGTELYDPIRIAEKVSDPLNPFSLAEDIAEHILALPLDQVDIRQVDEDFAGNPAYAPDTTGFPEYKINLSKILLGSTPWYEWTANTDNDGNLYYEDHFAESLRQYISYLIQLPAYQLI